MSKSDQLLVNNLIYTLPSSETVATQRNDMRNYFDQRDYNAGQTIRAVFQTGSRFIDVLNSQLVFDVVCTDVAGATVSWGKGSAINLIKNVRVYHSNGTELVNIQNHNVNQMISDKSTKSREWFNNVGYLAGYDSANTVSGLGSITPTAPATTVQQDPIVGGSQQFIIPLSCVAPIYNPVAKQLLPNVFAGHILEIDLASSAEAVVRTGGAANVEISLKNIYLNLSTSVLSDMAVGSLNDVASKSLIEYVYVDTYTTRINNPANNGTISTSVNKAVSFADHIVTGEVLSASRNSQTADEFQLDTQSSKYQYQLGSIQLPSQVFTDSIHKAYLQLLKTYNRFIDDSQAPAITYENYGGNMYTKNKTCSFSKDQLLALSQLPINSSRSLRYEQNYNTAPADARTVFVFLHYIKSLRCSLTDCTVNM
jgi:hypothetical protein